MTPLQRFQAALAQLQNDGCSENSTAQKACEEYQRQVEQANQQLREKQKQAREKRNEINSK